MRILILAAMFVSCVPAFAASGEYPFAEHETGPIYSGPAKRPQFAGRDKAFRSYRTRIVEALRQGPNFASRYKIVQIGCGAGCTFAVMGDVSSGKLFSFPLGGENNMYMTLTTKPTSAFLVANWIEGQNCREKQLVWMGREFTQSEARTVGDADYCYKLANR